VNVAVTGSQVLVGDRPVAELRDGYFAESAIEENTLPTVVDALKAEFELRFGNSSAADLAAAAADSDSDDQRMNEPIIVVQADRELEYRTLYLILRSAATAGFFKYRLAILRA
jgi:biopolymer transport protein ExbD